MQETRPDPVLPDEVVRQFLGLALGGIEIRDEAVHTMADGRRFLGVHGDLYDAVVQQAKWLALVGDQLYTLILKLNRWFNHIRARLGRGYWSLSQYLKHKAKNAVNFMTAFEDAVAREARRRGFQGVVCGHIHKPQIKAIDGIVYCNDGDWVESLSALVETHEGELKIVDWKLCLPSTAALNTHETEEEAKNGGVKKRRGQVLQKTEGSGLVSCNGYGQVSAMAQEFGPFVSGQAPPHAITATSSVRNPHERPSSYRLPALQCHQPRAAGSGWRQAQMRQMPQTPV